MCQAAPLQPPPYGPLHPGQSPAGRGLGRAVSFLDDDARQTTYNRLDSAHMIDAATGAIYILKTNADALN
jgi:hypothetical protein